ncbi:hypothetical protein ABIC86_000607 [Paenibacillus sp. DS2363]|nr:hypothetical protein PAEAM_21970 [Paenibacillus sp. GM1FR]
MFLFPVRRITNRHLALQFIKLTGSIVPICGTICLGNDGAGMATTIGLIRHGVTECNNLRS